MARLAIDRKAAIRRTVRHGRANRAHRADFVCRAVHAAAPDVDRFAALRYGNRCRMQRRRERWSDTRCDDREIVLGKLREDTCGHRIAVAEANAQRAVGRDVICGEDAYVVAVDGDDRSRAEGVIAGFVSDDDDGAVCIAIRSVGGGRCREGCADESDEGEHPARGHTFLVGMPDGAVKLLATTVTWRIGSSQT